MTFCTREGRVLCLLKVTQVIEAKDNFIGNHQQFIGYSRRHLVNPHTSGKLGQTKLNRLLLKITEPHRPGACYWKVRDWEWAFSLYTEAKITCCGISQKKEDFLRVLSAIQSIQWKIHLDLACKRRRISKCFHSEIRCLCKLLRFFGRKRLLWNLIALSLNLLTL